MNAERLQAIRERHGKTSPGPWYPQYVDDTSCMCAELVTLSPKAEHNLYDPAFDPKEVVAVTVLQYQLADVEEGENTEFIAHAWQDVKDLLAYVEQLESRIKAE